MYIKKKGVHVENEQRIDGEHTLHTACHLVDPM